MTIDFITATYADFEPLIGQTVSVETQTGNVTLTLEKVTVKENIKPRDNVLEIDGIIYPPRQTFSLSFVGPKTPLLDGNSYYVSHDKFAKEMLFISPYFEDENAVYYETVFS